MSFALGQQPRQERPAPQRPAPQRPAPEQPQPGPGAPDRSQSGQDPWGRRQEPPQRRSRGYDGRYDDRRNDSHEEFADRRFRRDSSYSDYPGQQQPSPPRASRPAPRPAPQPAPQPAPPQAPSRQSGHRAGQQPEAYDPYSFESYGPRDRDRDRDRVEPPAPAPRAPRPQPRRRQPDQGYDEQAYPGYEQGYDQAYAQGYDYDYKGHISDFAACDTAYYNGHGAESTIPGCATYYYSDHDFIWARIKPAA